MNMDTHKSFPWVRDYALQRHSNTPHLVNVTLSNRLYTKLFSDMNNLLQMEITVDNGHWVALATSHPPLGQVTPMVIFYYKKHSLKIQIDGRSIFSPFRFLVADVALLQMQ